MAEGFMARARALALLAVVTLLAPGITSVGASASGTACFWSIFDAEALVAEPPRLVWTEGNAGTSRQMADSVIDASARCESGEDPVNPTPGCSGLPAVAVLDGGGSGSPGAHNGFFQYPRQVYVYFPTVAGFDRAGVVICLLIATIDFILYMYNMIHGCADEFQNHLDAIQLYDCLETGIENAPPPV